MAWGGGVVLETTRRRARGGDGGGSREQAAEHRLGLETGPYPRLLALCPETGICGRQGGRVRFFFLPCTLAPPHASPPPLRFPSPPHPPHHISPLPASAHPPHLPPTAPSSPAKPDKLLGFFNEPKRWKQCTPISPDLAGDEGGVGGRRGGGGPGRRARGGDGRGHQRAVSAVVPCFGLP